MSILGKTHIKKGFFSGRANSIIQLNKAPVIFIQ